MKKCKIIRIDTVKSPMRNRSVARPEPEKGKEDKESNLVTEPTFSKGK